MADGQDQKKNSAQDDSLKTIPAARQTNRYITASGAITASWLGLKSYEEGLESQEHALALLSGRTGNQSSVEDHLVSLSSLAEARHTDTPLADTPQTGLPLSEILGLEHCPVITLGKRGRTEMDLVASVEEIRSAGFDLVVSPRGGQATLHSPGQLVIYPCFNLQRSGFGVREFVNQLEKCTQTFLRELSIESQPSSEEPGLYTSTGKIAFFGLRVSRGLASHGLAINVSNDTQAFNLIRSCGKSRESFDALKHHGIDIPLPELFFRWSRCFLETLVSRSSFGR